jgi:hypothetical protein
MDADQQHWLNETVEIQRRVALALGQPERVKRFVVIRELAEQLELDPETISVDVEQLLEKLLWPLNIAVEAGSPVGEEQPRRVAHAVVGNFGIEDLIYLADDLGWTDRTAVQNTVTFGHLQLTVEESFEGLLANRIHVMLRRWERNGAFDKRAAYPAARPRRSRSTAR